MDELREMLLRSGAALVGYADLGTLPAEGRQNMASGISIGVALNPHIVSQIENGPTKEYYAEYCRANDLLNMLSHAAVRFLESLERRAVPLAATSTTDSATLSVRLPHKTVATRAGLGWIGKCALLVTEQFGSAIRLVTVLTDSELPADRPAETSRCGSCTSCVEICPGRAPTGKDWQPGMYRGTLFNPFACARAAREMARKEGIDETICGMCIAACPWTKKYISRIVTPLGGNTLEASP